MSKPKEERQDRHGVIRLMAEANGWVMVRRPGAMPFTMMRKEWDKLPTVQAAEGES